MGSSSVAARRIRNTRRKLYSSIPCPLQRVPATATAFYRCLLAGLDKDMYEVFTVNLQQLLITLLPA
ncbi:hypothetical protein GQ600_20745 [Phytophthora cactorum]|nr:hypothetical protein GQ600_20745 [Phytophthora cactorum]